MFMFQGWRLAVLAIIVLAQGACADEDLLALCTVDPADSKCANAADFYTDAMVADHVESLCADDGRSGAMPWMPSCV